MNQSAKTGKLIVSKGEYARLQGKRAQASLIGVGSMLLAVLSGFAGASLIAILGYHLYFPTRRFLLDMFVFKSNDHPQDTLINIVLFDGGGIVVLFGLAYLYGTFGYDQLKEAREIDPGVPLTRSNAADLSAPESLVRASVEPIQEQQAVLLRAAIEVTQTPPEELVRASTGQA